MAAIKLILATILVVTVWASTVDGLVHRSVVAVKKSPPVVRKSPPVVRKSPPPPARKPKVVLVGGKPNGFVFNVAFDWPAAKQPLVFRGDTLRFQWTGTKAHDVWRLANAAAYTNCDFTGATKLTGVFRTYTYDFLVPATTPVGSTLFFACKVINHCEAAQKIGIRVAG